MSREHAADVMQQICERDTWKFKKNISEQQVEQTQTYLRNLGFDMEWIAVVPWQEDTPTVEEGFSKAPEKLLPPVEEPPPKSWLERLKKYSSPNLQKPNLHNSPFRVW